LVERDLTDAAVAYEKQIVGRVCLIHFEAHGEAFCSFLQQHYAAHSSL
jgi:hypothetical protein